MMHELRTFTNEEFGDVRTVMIDGNPYFCGKDVATSLGYAKPTDTVKRHCNKVVKHIAPTRGGNQEMLFIPGCDVLRLVTRSKLPSAEKFEDWVMDEVLPQMRETGEYIPVEEDDDDSVIMARGLLIAQKTIEEKDKIEDPIERAKRWIEEQEEKKKLEATIEEQKRENAKLKPDADFANDILLAPGTVTAAQIAKEYGMSEKMFNNLLHILGIQFKVNGQWLLYAKYADKGYTKSETVQIERDGVKDCVMNTRWTEKGRQFLYESLKKRGIYSKIERAEINKWLLK